MGALSARQGGMMRRQHNGGLPQGTLSSKSVRAHDGPRDGSPLAPRPLLLLHKLAGG